MAVDRCICTSVRFSEALELARRHSCRSVAELQRFTPLGTGCGLCIAYMQLALESGSASLPVLPVEEMDRLRRRSGVTLEEGRT